jgi:hypothetical protein
MEVFPSSHLNTDTHPVTEMLRFIVFRIPDEGDKFQKPNNFEDTYNFNMAVAVGKPRDFFLPPYCTLNSQSIMYQRMMSDTTIYFKPTAGPTIEGRCQVPKISFYLP